MALWVEKMVQQITTLPQSFLKWYNSNRAIHASGVCQCLYDVFTANLLATGLIRYEKINIQIMPRV